MRNARAKTKKKNFIYNIGNIWGWSMKLYIGKTMQNNNNACEPLKALLGWSFISNIVNTIKIDADFAHKKLRCYATKGVALVVTACSLSRSGLINCTAISEVLAFYVFQSQQFTMQWLIHVAPSGNAVHKRPHLNLRKKHW